MPDIEWSRPLGSFCQEFRPDLDAKGEMKSDGAIRCHDSDVPSWWSTQWVWNYEGESSEESLVANMLPADVDVDRGKVWFRY